MSSIIETSNGPNVILSDSLSHSTRYLVQAAKSYDTVILLYEDDFTDSVLGAWAELDRLSLKTRRVGNVLNGVEVRAFGMAGFLPGTVLEIHLREASLDQDGRDIQRATYRSLLNEVCLISVKVYQTEQGSMMLQ